MSRDREGPEDVQAVSFPGTRTPTPAPPWPADERQWLSPHKLQTWEQSQCWSQESLDRLVTQQEITGMRFLPSPPCCRKRKFLDSRLMPSIQLLQGVRICGLDSPSPVSCRISPWDSGQGSETPEPGAVPEDSCKLLGGDTYSVFRAPGLCNLQVVLTKHCFL